MGVIMWLIWDPHHSEHLRVTQSVKYWTSDWNVEGSDFNGFAKGDNYVIMIELKKKKSITVKKLCEMRYKILQKHIKADYLEII